jgi:hypothetical protein
MEEYAAETEHMFAPFLSRSRKLGQYCTLVNLPWEFVVDLRHLRCVMVHLMP